MTPYHLFAAAATQHPEKSFLAVCYDFACWERARGFADDPNATSKEDIEWIQTLYDLAQRLRERAGDTQDCHNALEASAAAFAGLDHEPQLCEAVRRWRAQRLQEQSEETQAAANGSPADARS